MQQEERTYRSLQRAVDLLFYACLEVDPARDRVLVLQSREWPRGEAELCWSEYLERYAAIFSPVSAGELRRRLSCQALTREAGRGESFTLELSYAIHGRSDLVSVIVHPRMEGERAVANVFVRATGQDDTFHRIIDLYIYSSCDYFLCLDARQNSYIMFSGSDSGTPLPPAECQDYESALVDYARSFVVPEDQEMVIREMHIPRVLEQLERRGVHTFYCGVIDPGRGYTRKQLTYRYYDRNARLVLLSRTDVTGVYLEERARQKELQAARLLAESDPLTGLLNYGGVQARICRALEEGGGSALLFLDLDDFKVVNDTLGHPGGDQLLRRIAQVLRAHAGEEGIPGRVGGDEFVVFLPGVGERRAAEERARIICEAVGRLSLPENGAPTVTCSIGIAPSPEDGREYSQLVRAADRRAYQAKAQGKNRFL